MNNLPESKVAATAAAVVPSYTRGATTQPLSTLGQLKLEARQFSREYLGTMVTEFSVLAAQLIVYRLAADFLGQQGFAEYAVARRAVSFLQPIMLLGMAVALPRFIAHGGGTSTRGRPFFGAALRIIVPTALVTWLVLNAFPGWFGFLFFGSSQYGSLIPAISFFMLGLILHSMVYAYFRGNLLMKQANLLQLVNTGLIPVAVFLFFAKDVRSVFLMLGAGVTGVSLLALLLTPLRQVLQAGREEVRPLLSYGLRRMPADFIQMALFALPAILIAHSVGVREAGFVAFGISVLTMIATLFAPLNLVLMPKASQMFGEGSLASLRAHVLRLAKGTVWISLLFLVLIEVLGEMLVVLYLGPAFSEVAATIRILALGALPFGLYTTLHGVLDAHSTRPTNTVNNGLALVVFLFGSGALILLNGSQLIPWALVVSFFVLGILTVKCTWAAISLAPAEGFSQHA